MAALREDVLASAVAFLQNPKVQESPLARRIAFLESKGLTADEVQEALRRANPSTASTASTATSAAPAAASAAAPAGTVQYAVAPAGYPPGTVIVPATHAASHGSLTQRASATSWKDIFIGAVLAGGTGYAALKALQVRAPKPRTGATSRTGRALTGSGSPPRGRPPTALGAAEPELAVG